MSAHRRNYRWRLGALLCCSLLFVIPPTQQKGGPMNYQHIHWLGHATFRIEDGATQMYIDPWKLPPNCPKADVIFITHAHYDHFSKEDIAKISKEGTVFFAPKDVAYQLKGTVIGVAPSENYNLGELKVKTIPAYNIGKQFHPKQNNWVGYIITLSTGQRIYHSGDTDCTPEMKSVVTDVALMPVGGTVHHDGERSSGGRQCVQTTGCDSDALGGHRRI